MPPLEFQFGPNAYDIDIQVPELDIPEIAPPISISQAFIRSSIQTAALIKKSTIPEKAVHFIDTTVELGYLLEAKYGLMTRIKDVAMSGITFWINCFSVIMIAVMQSIITYHNTPGRAYSPEIVAIPNSGQILIAVGGQQYATDYSCIFHYPNSHLARLVMKSRASSLFIDRDPTHFRHILNYLRGCDSLSHQSSVDLHEILQEAEFYELAPLVDRIRTLQSSRAR